MYHTLLRYENVWISTNRTFTRSVEWSDDYQLYLRRYGLRNILCIPWGPDDLPETVEDLASLMRRDAILANLAQKLWDKGEFSDLSDGNGQLDLNRAVTELKRSRRY